MTRHIFSEFVDHAALRAPGLLAQLAAREVGLIVAVQPHQVEGVEGVVEACRGAGVGVGLWPMLDDAQGRWASTSNADAFAAHAAGLLARLEARGALPDELLVDLEPPISLTRRMLRGRLQRVEGRGSAAQALRALIGDAHARGVMVRGAVVAPTVLTDEQAARGWQALLGTPVDALDLDRVCPMLYSSLIEGYSRGALRRQDARALLDRMARAVARRHAGRASAALGVVGVGALGDEARYRDPEELAEDVAIVRAAGVEELALFNLRGVLERPPLSDWLEALTSAPAAQRPVMTLRARAVWRLMHGIGGVAARAAAPAAG